MFVETVNTRFIQYLKCSTQNRENVCVSNSTASILDEPSCQHCRYEDSLVSGILVFKMFYSKHPVLYLVTQNIQFCIWFLFPCIWYSGIQNVLLKTSSLVSGYSKHPVLYLVFVPLYLVFWYSKCSTQNIRFSKCSTQNREQNMLTLSIRYSKCSTQNREQNMSTLLIHTFELQCRF